ncbi:hypothetical protein ACH4UY_35280 [Streptomyces longwoodensis]|uniref:hypothetical protein n=1 Tax=Streptomyces longwoodensis TaxID=68231 RepID=UPI0037B8EA0E
MRRLLLVTLGLTLTVALAGCDRSRENSVKTIRKLAGSEKANRARKQTEMTMRNVITSWDERTPLTLGLVALDDVCIGGKGKEWFFPTGDDQYKIRCSMYVTAYFGAKPGNISEVIEGILAAGDEDRGDIPFGHDFDYANRVVDYYRGKGGEPQGPGTGEPSQLFAAATLTLDWDQVRTNSKIRKTIEEPRACEESEPPIRRCLREPKSMSVADIRQKFGMVFRLAFPVRDYFVVPKQ